MNLIATIWVALCVIIFRLPFSPAGVFFKKGSDWKFVNYAPVVITASVARVTRFSRPGPTQSRVSTTFPGGNDVDGISSGAAG